jgi:hypothetical protein
MHRARASQLNHHCSAVVRDEAELPQEQMEVCVVAVAEERFRMAGDEIGIEMGKHLQLVLTADARHHGRDGRICERGVKIAGTVGRRGLGRARCRVLDRPKVELVRQPPKP